MSATCRWSHRSRNRRQEEGESWSYGPRTFAAIFSHVKFLQTQRLERIHCDEEPKSAKKYIRGRRASLKWGQSFTVSSRSLLMFRVLHKCLVLLRSDDMYNQFCECTIVVSLFAKLWRYFTFNVMLISISPCNRHIMDDSYELHNHIPEILPTS